MNTTMAANVDEINRVLAGRGDTFTVSFREVPKSSGYTKNAYEIRDIAQASISANPLVYEENIRNMTINDLASYLEDVHANSRISVDEHITEKSYIMQHVMPHVASAEKAEFFKRQGYAAIPYLDMVITFAVEVGDGFYTLSETHLQKEGIRYDHLVSAAIEHVEHDYSIRRISELLMNLGAGSQDDGLPLFVITRRSADCQYGAGVILSHRILRETSERLGGDMIIYPSSVHEILAMPYTVAPEVREARKMVQEINENVVAPEDVLTNSVYIWHSDTETLEIAD